MEIWGYFHHSYLCQVLAMVDLIPRVNQIIRVMMYVHLLNPKKTEAESSELVFIMNIINTAAS